MTIKKLKTPSDSISTTPEGSFSCLFQKYQNLNYGQYSYSINARAYKTNP